MCSCEAPPLCLSCPLRPMLLVRKSQSKNIVCCLAFPPMLPFTQLKVGPNCRVSIRVCYNIVLFLGTVDTEMFR